MKTFLSDYCPYLILRVKAQMPCKQRNYFDSCIERLK